METEDWLMIDFSVEVLTPILSHPVPESSSRFLDSRKNRLDCDLSVCSELVLLKDHIKDYIDCDSIISSTCKGCVILTVILSSFVLPQTSVSPLAPPLLDVYSPAPSRGCPAVMLSCRLCNRQCDRILLLRLRPLLHLGLSTGRLLLVSTRPSALQLHRIPLSHRLPLGQSSLYFHLGLTGRSLQSDPTALRLKQVPTSLRVCLSLQSHRHCLSHRVLWLRFERSTPRLRQGLWYLRLHSAPSVLRLRLQIHLFSLSVVPQILLVSATTTPS
ncbi:uncharacterized protein LOC107655349 [Sinocyclocheilus anshuiensis]|uniref:uncharacterized protein LOC107655349 n=1 Tax=Sinocyclocheilus anshuiensis TaxID=1608454 RepID=UPI0007B856C7|nr:PREDICTED: uncharacterized protein LOC107655349 [Sinocyclocheilus anshuiensis]XP_016298291.1 PREDICTED: uncharacterized protein LOC107655349 [Sinocyclocheilus anshuiensis]